MIKANLAVLLNDATNGVPGLGLIYDIKVKKPVVKVTGKVRNSDDERRIVILADRVDCVDLVDTSGLKVACSDSKALDNANILLSLRPCVLTDVHVTVRGGVATLSGTVPSKKYKRAVRYLVEAADCVDSVKNTITFPPPPDEEMIDCNTISDATLKGIVERELNARLSCAASRDIRVMVAEKVVTLTGTTTNNGNFAASRVVNRLRCVLGVRSMIAEAIPQCPTGALSCVTSDGEQWCCFGCRRCPLSY